MCKVNVQVANPNTDIHEHVTVTYEQTYQKTSQRW